MAQEIYISSKCGNCGKPVERGASKCPHCGVQLVGEKKQYVAGGTSSNEITDAHVKAVFICIGVFVVFMAIVMIRHYLEWGRF